MANQFEQPSEQQFQQLIQEILVVLRGSMTQAELSQKLGYSFNQVGKWEALHTAITWSQFLKLGESVGIPLWSITKSALALSHRSTQSLDSTTDPRITDLLFPFMGLSKEMEIATTLGKSRSAVRRILSQERELDLIEVLRLLNLRPFALQNWLSRFVDVKTLVSFQRQMQRERDLLESLAEIPWSPIVNSALQAERYRQLPHHDEMVLANLCGLSVEQVRAALEKLLSVGAIHIERGLFRNRLTELTLIRSPQMRKFTAFLADHVASHVSASGPKTANPKNPSLTAVRVYPLSEAGARKVAEALVRYHHEISKIVAQDDEAPTHVRATVIHSVDMSLLNRDAADTEQLEPNSDQLSRNSPEPEAH